MLERAEFSVSDTTVDRKSVCHFNFISADTFFNLAPWYEALQRLFAGTSPIMASGSYFGPDCNNLLGWAVNLNVNLNASAYSCASLKVNFLKFLLSDSV